MRATEVLEGDGPSVRAAIFLQVLAEGTKLQHQLQQPAKRSITSFMVVVVCFI